MKARYREEGVVVAEERRGTGCLLTATHCPSLGFKDDDTFVETPSSRNDTASLCEARARATYASCTTDMANEEKPYVRITAEFYAGGQLERSATYPLDL